ncbi:D-arabinono-1,4-lactone oxidase [Lysinibacillus pakistanensis]|uniref:D-arabinono-1,4-lactone oxidase n=1 Tax=Lysinibacillus pakistanensis TaxID=759811 RepID=A0AAX3WR41_9BACI|nr:D-arabinono-1,4-lactone oxidase [Lysinibacillus pakistanensis]MDM5234056.1 D-arabinono-1,4-lactone oxidase [Lysinibacillus pakistanensis]WHY44658.1 D-arabinono-1,4-lactone oxidase [Lysinibacillus pakistanensis]WHY49664.1 D-arabinono-1,4-lactone oxidase [Lysinibacillus pakistanensis]
MFSIEKWKNGEKWTNWAGNVISYPGEMYLPQSIEDVVQIVKQARESGKTIRVTGAAHSFSAVAMPEHIALSLHNMRGLIAVNEEKQEATLWAGTYLYEIGPSLAKHGFALSNMGDIQEQSIAGAVSTGTHGTGVTLGSLSSTVTKWGFVDGTGTYREHTRGLDDLSESLHVSLGMLGVLVKVTIKVIPLYGLHYIGTRDTLTNGLSIFAEDIRQHRHVEWFYFPGSETIQVKRMNAVDPVYQSDWSRRIEIMKLQIVENGAFLAMSELCKWKPSLSGAMSKIAAANVVEGEKTGISYEIYPSPRSVKFQESEYAIPLMYFEACMEEIHATFKKGLFNVHFPLECRTTAGEAGFLSPTQGHESAFIAFHMYKGMPEEPYFEWIHTMMKKYKGRPHWGKQNHLTAGYVYELYPDIEKFLAIRRQYDPDNVFFTGYLRKLFTL